MSKEISRRRLFWKKVHSNWFQTRGFWKCVLAQSYIICMHFGWTHIFCKFSSSETSGLAGLRCHSCWCSFMRIWSHKVDWKTFPHKLTGSNWFNFAGQVMGCENSRESCENCKDNCNTECTCHCHQRHQGSVLDVREMCDLCTDSFPGCCDIVEVCIECCSDRWVLFLLITAFYSLVHNVGLNCDCVGYLCLIVKQKQNVPKHVYL